MRASYIAIIAAALAIPAVAYGQDSGPVGGKVGSDLSTVAHATRAVRWVTAICGALSNRSARRLRGLGRSWPGRAARCAHLAATGRNGLRLH